MNKSELEGYRAKLKLYRGHMKALFVCVPSYHCCDPTRLILLCRAFDQLEKDFNKLVSDTKPYNPPAPKGKIVSAWHSVGNRSAAPRRPVQRTHTMPMPSINPVQEQNDGACPHTAATRISSCFGRAPGTLNAGRCCMFPRGVDTLRFVRMSVCIFG